jgi:outer membrane protein assembly factor BamB
LRRRSAVAAAALGLCAAATAVLVLVHRSGRDVIGSSTTEYVRTTHPAPAPPTLPWPQWGRDPQRTRAAPSSLRPPFRVRWVFHGRSLLEFPPSLGYGRVYLPTFDGRLVALSTGSGRVLWRYRSGRCAWASPAVAGGLVFQTFLLRPPACRAGSDAHGLLVAFDAATGRIRWRARMAPTESSPLVSRSRLWLADWSGDVISFDARTGRRRWTFRVDAAVKSSPALAGRRLFVATYGGRLYALDAASGAELWHASVQRRLFGRGRFYSTPAVAHGRVYLGATDGKVYAYGAQSGRLRWSFSTGGYVYGSPAVHRDLVLIGSYDRHFYALDAATGAVRWSFDARGRISGAPTVLGDAVYVSTLEEQTFALDVRTGRELWRFPDGKYSAGVADEASVYLVGAGRLFALAPR